MRQIVLAQLTAKAFEPFGEVIEARGEAERIINGGRCRRFNDLAALDFGPGGRAGISVFLAQPQVLPYRLEMLERHPNGSQAFLPMTQHPFLVIVAGDMGGIPGVPVAFVTDGAQGINLRRGTWHGVLTPLAVPGLFAVVDRIDDMTNLEEYWFDCSYLVAEAEAAGRD